MQISAIIHTNHFILSLKQCLKIAKKLQKIRRGPKLEGCAFAKFGNSSGTEGEPSQKREKLGENVPLPTELLGTAARFFYH